MIIWYQKFLSSLRKFNKKIHHTRIILEIEARIFKNMMLISIGSTAYATTLLVVNANLVSRHDAAPKFQYEIPGHPKLRALCHFDTTTTASKSTSTKNKKEKSATQSSSSEDESESKNFLSQLKETIMDFLGEGMSVLLLSYFCFLSISISFLFFVNVLHRV